MSLSVNSAANALAALQALSLQPSSTASSNSASASAPADASPSIQHPSVQPGATQSLFAAVNGVGQALTAADAADAAGQTVIGLLQQMRDTAGQASGSGLDGSDRARLQSGFQAQAGQINVAVGGADVNGVNLIDGSLTASLRVSLGGGATASLSPTDLTLGGATLAQPPGVATATAAAASFASLGEALGAASGALSTLRGQADQIGAYAGFVQALGQALATPQDDSADSVRLLALQVSQQLAAQPAAVANTSPQSVLSLFRS